MRQRWRRRAGRWALGALLLQLALPFLTLQHAIARPDLDAAFVICTGAGPVWVRPDGTPAERGPDEPQPGHHCPVCLGQQLAATALLPASSPLFLPQHRAAGITAPAVRGLSTAAGAAPPLPARGPPRHG